MGAQPNVTPAAEVVGDVTSERSLGGELFGARMCKGWETLSAKLCAEELEQVSYDFWYGGLWGRCCLCNNKWLDEKHVNSYDHRCLGDRGAAACANLAWLLFRAECQSPTSKCIIRPLTQVDLLMALS